MELALMVGVVALVIYVAVSLVGSPQEAEADGGQVVLASFYGEELSGSPQANGEPFAPWGYTAAHKTLPLGSMMTVCHEGCVDVTVEDRGPYVGDRAVDLSKGAAAEIGMLDEGVALVEVFPWQE